jgi:hypothetical protein
MADSPSPPTRHLLEPIETRQRNLRQPIKLPLDQTSIYTEEPVSMLAAQTKPRRFLPQPVEESTRSNRKVNGTSHDQISKARTRIADISDAAGEQPPHKEASQRPVTPEAKPRRRFVAEPVETSTRSFKRKANAESTDTNSSSNKAKDGPAEEDDVETTPKPRRRFAPEPLETSARSSKDKKKDEGSSTAPPRRKFTPQPIETTTSSSRRRQVSLDDICEEGQATDQSTTSSRASSFGHRKFSPELIDTAKGSYRRVHLPSPDPNQPPTPAQTDPPTPPKDTDDDREEDFYQDEPEESRFSAAALARKNSEPARQHSFVVPDLPAIDSTTEDETDPPSLADTSSSYTSISANKPRIATKDSYTEYVLRMAAETMTEQELKEQAMAAYINERPHEPVDHFAVSHDDEEDGPLPVPVFHGEKGVPPSFFRRSSAAELQLEMDSMRKHHEQFEAAKRDYEHDTAGQSRFSAAALATRHAMEAKGLTKTKKAKADEEWSELARMRAAASPPMLGGDIKFPFTISPKMTRCDPDQVPRPRRAESSEENDENNPDLWHSPQKIENNSPDGLWMGMCQAGLWQPKSPQPGLRSGIHTPAPPTPTTQKQNPFDLSANNKGTRTPGHKTPSRRLRPFSETSQLPLSPPLSQGSSDSFTNSIDAKLRLEKQIEEEFPNSVITQIYNYLSLGYPSLAHTFDEELSKISRIPVEELRKDDDNVDAKGYVGAPEGEGWHEEEVVGKCKRWEALRLYVVEWARQSPNFADERRKANFGVGVQEDWGARVRKGSWAH